MKSVFISSTQRDLSEYRDAVKAAIERLDLRAIDMRNFGAQPGGAVSTSVREVRKGDIYVGILAQRYGYVPDGMTKSVTEQEYDEAVRLKLPRLMYLLDDRFAWDAERIEADPTAQAKLQAFKDRVNANEVRSLFTTPDDLAKQVTADLVKLLDKGRRQTLITRGLAALLTVIVLIALVLMTVPQIHDEVSKVVFGPSPMPTTTPMPTEIPPEGTPFVSDQIGVVLADFKNDEPGVNNLGDALELAFNDPKTNIPYVRVHHVLKDRVEAQQTAKLYNATIVVWGVKNSLGVQVNYEIDTKKLDDMFPFLSLNSYETTSDPQVHGINSNLLIPVDTHFSTFVINDGMGVPYMLDFTRGLMFMSNGDYTKALNDFNAAVQRIPKGQEAEAQAAALFFSRGTTFMQLLEDDEAISDFTQALQLKPDYDIAYALRCVLYTGQQKYDLALSDCNQVIQYDPNVSIGYLLRSIIYENENMTNFFISDFIRAAQLQPPIIVPSNFSNSMEIGIVNHNYRIEYDPSWLTPTASEVTAAVTP